VKDNVITTFIQGLVTGYLQTGDTEWLRKAHQMIAELEDHMLNTEYYGINEVNANTGEVLSNNISTLGVGELPAWLVRVGRPRLAKKLFNTAVDTLFYDGIPTKRVNYKTREVVNSDGTIFPEVADSAEALYSATGDHSYLYPVWEAYKACRKHARKEYGYATIDVKDKTVKNSWPEEILFADSILSVGYALFSRNPHLQLEKTYRMTWGYPFKIFP